MPGTLKKSLLWVEEAVPIEFYLSGYVRGCVVQRWRDEAHGLVGVGLPSVFRGAPGPNKTGVGLSGRPGFHVMVYILNDLPEGRRNSDILIGFRAIDSLGP